MEARGNALAVDARVHLLLEVCAALALRSTSLLYASTGVSPAGEEELRGPGRFTESNQLVHGRADELPAPR